MGLYMLPFVTVTETSQRGGRIGIDCYAIKPISIYEKQTRIFAAAEAEKAAGR